jgi:hypothetical protein
MERQLPSLNELDAYREWLKTTGVGKTSQNNRYHATKKVLASAVKHEDDVNWVFAGASETWRKDLRRGWRLWNKFQTERFPASTLRF